MPGRDKIYREQRREREADQLEKKFDEVSRAECLRRAKRQIQSVMAELAEAAAEEEQYHRGLSISFQSMGSETIRRRIDSIRKDLMSTTSYAQDLIELLVEMEDELARRGDR